MMPLYAQGAAQAIEDAAALATSLRETESLNRGLRAYESIREPRSSTMLELSRARLAHHHLSDGPSQLQRDRDFAARDALEDSSWIYDYDAEAEASAALTGSA